MPLLQNENNGTVDLLAGYHIAILHIASQEKGIREWHVTICVSNALMNTGIKLQWNTFLLWKPITHAWWHPQMEKFSASLAICAGNSPVTGKFSAQRPVTRNFDVFFDLRLNKRLSKQSWGWWFETPLHSLWRHRNENLITSYNCWYIICGDVVPSNISDLTVLLYVIIVYMLVT